MRITSNVMIAAFAIASLPLSACERGTERWATTDNTNVPIDWDKVNEAYKSADGPADFEKRVNEIYEGDEVIRKALPEDMYRVFMHYKRDEWERHCAEVTDWDVKEYLDVLP